LQHNPVDGHAVSTAKQELTAANGDFTQLNADLSWIPGAASATPKYGSLLSAGKRLAPVAVELTSAGMTACDALNLLITRLKNPLDPQSAGISQADVTTLNHDFAQVTALFNRAVVQIGQLSPSDLQADPRLGPAVTQLKAALPRIHQGLAALQTVIGALPLLLGVGTPSNYLVEQLDSTELRPGGGFIGTYGILTVTGGRLQTIQMQDVDLLDAPYKYGDQVIPIPPEYAWFSGLFPRWGFRDSNLDADFPTSAQNGEQLYHTEGGKEQLQGVIAITPWLIQKALKITGPIDVPEYHETITADNFIERIHYHQLLYSEGADSVLDPTTGTSLRKRFTGFLFEHFMARVKAMAATPQIADLAKLAMDSIHSKDIQFYLNDHATEQVLQQYHLSSAIEAPATGDSLFVVDANIIADKANSEMTYVMQDAVTLDASGTAVHKTTLTYTWPVSDYSSNSNWAFGFTDYYEDYLRVYVPPNSVLQSQSGWIAKGTSQAFGRTVFAGKVFVPYGGQPTTVSLTWSVPNAALHDSAGWHYRSLVQKQAGITWTYQPHVILPACASGVVAMGLAVSGNGITLPDPHLAQDLTLGLDYVCAAGK
jgi:hypothetical protein